MIVEGKLKAKAARTMIKKKSGVWFFSDFGLSLFIYVGSADYRRNQNFWYTTLYPFCCAIMMNIIISAWFK